MPESEFPLGILSTNDSFWISKVRGGLTNDFDEEFDLEIITFRALEVQMFQGSFPLRILLTTIQAATDRAAFLKRAGPHVAAKTRQLRTQLVKFEQKSNET